MLVEAFDRAAYGIGSFGSVVADARTTFLFESVQIDELPLDFFFFWLVQGELFCVVVHPGLTARSGLCVV